MKLKIWHFMVAVAIVAILFTIGGIGGVGLGVALFAALGCAYQANSCAHWLVAQERRRLAAFGFWVPAVSVVALFAALCVSPEIYLLFIIFLVWLLIVPMIAVFGIAWAVLVTRSRSAWRCFVPAAWLSVVAMLALPLATSSSLWPLHLAFRIARPALDRLADQVAAGQASGLPRWVGPFRVAGSAVDPVTGNVGLLIDPNPGGPTGLVRVRPAKPPDRRGPIRSDDLLVELGWGWEYREED